MRVAHNFLIYTMIPMFSVDPIRESVQNYPDFKEKCDVADLFMCFVVAVHLIGHTTHEAPSDQDIVFARECLNSYVRGFFWVFGFSFMKYKNHCLIHLADEAKFRKSHLGGFNAYIFENFLGLIRKFYVKSGKNVLAQVYNMLTKKAYHGPGDEGHFCGEEFGDEVFVNLAKEHKSLDYPQQTVMFSNVGKGRKRVVCRGFQVTLR
jgi:hypothetical protein